MAWRFQGEVVPASQKDPEGWGSADNLTEVLETACLNATELCGYCRERGLFPEQLVRWRQAAQDDHAQPLLTMADQKDLQKRHKEDQREIKRLQQELRRNEKALAAEAALLIASKKIKVYWGEDEWDCPRRKFAARPWRPSMPPGRPLHGPGSWRCCWAWG